ncbi:MAG: hypothetical protein P4L76_15310 [Beijerinckiaceae bacterium]|nr:hypothetical protein [Beijerinckiaceae bacterium]
MSADLVTALPLFYRSIEPLNRDVHRDYGLAMEAPPWLPPVAPAVSDPSARVIECVLP